MRNENDRRKAVDSRREVFRNMLAGMDEAAVLKLEAVITAQVGQINELIKRGEDEVDHKIELLSDIDDRLLYLERISFTNITKQLEQ